MLRRAKLSSGLRDRASVVARPIQGLIARLWISAAFVGKQQHIIAKHDDEVRQLPVQLLVRVGIGSKFQEGPIRDLSEEALGWRQASGPLEPGRPHFTYSPLAITVLSNRGRR